jgi:MYND finger
MSELSPIEKSAAKFQENLGNISVNAFEYSGFEHAIALNERYFNEIPPVVYNQWIKQKQFCTSQIENLIHNNRKEFISTIESILSIKCKSCGSCLKKKSTCGDCKCIPYCSPECQREDWQHEHRAKCIAYITDPYIKLLQIGLKISYESYEIMRTLMLAPKFGSNLVMKMLEKQYQISSNIRQLARIDISPITERTFNAIPENLRDSEKQLIFKTSKNENLIAKIANIELFGFQGGFNKFMYSNDINDIPMFPFDQDEDNMIFSFCLSIQFSGFKNVSQDTMKVRNFFEIITLRI